MRRRTSETTQSPSEIKLPVIVSQGRQFTRMVAFPNHTRLLQAFVLDTLAWVREMSRINKRCQRVKCALRVCFLWTRRRLQSESAPIAPLLRERITEASPFAIIGIDFAGLDTLGQHHRQPYRPTPVFSPARLLAPYTWGLV